MTSTHGSPGGSARPSGLARSVVSLLSFPLLLACHGPQSPSDEPDGGSASEMGQAPELGSTSDAASGSAPDAGRPLDLAEPALFDLPMIRDRASAQCTFSNQRSALRNGVSLTVWDVSYSSWESIDGRLVPIRIRGFAARPAGGDRLPGVVQAHGLGGYAEESHATGTASLLGMFVIAYSGPGGGTAPANTSEGKPAGDGSGYRIFDTVKDVRGSWLWGHAVAAMRGLTCLEGRADVDGGRLGMTGFSAGGVATLMAAGVDDRVKAAVPLSATGAFGVAMRAPRAWQHTLLEKAGLSAMSPEFLRHQMYLDPVVLLPGARARILMIDGTTDEFFPLTAYRATFDVVPDPDRRASLAANFDHGCYKVSGVEAPKDIEDRAELHASGGQRLWFRHWFGTDPRYATLPRAPQLQTQTLGAGTLFTATVDDGAPGLRMDEVRVWLSVDDALTFVGTKLDPAGGGLFTKLVPGSLPANAVYYVDVVYRTSGLIPERFALSSPPVLPAGAVPRIRSIANCLP